MRHKGAGRADSLLPVSPQLALLDSSFSPQDRVSLGDASFYCANAPGQIVPHHVTVETPQLKQRQMGFSQDLMLLLFTSPVPH